MSKIINWKYDPLIFDLFLRADIHYANVIQPQYVRQVYIIFLADNAPAKVELVSP